MIDVHTLSIDEIGLSRRSQNALHRYEIHTVEDMLQQTEQSLYQISNLGAKSVAEILEKIQYYGDPGNMEKLAARLEKGSPISWDAAVLKYLADKNLTISVLDLLSPRAYNLLNMNKICKLQEIWAMDRDALLQIPRMSESCVDEIQENLKNYLAEHEAEIDAYTAPEKLPIPQPEPNDIRKSQKWKDALFQYTKIHDQPLEQLNLSARPLNQLKRSGYNMLSEILFLTESDLLQIKNMGKNSVPQILERISAHIEKSEKYVRALMTGDNSALWDDSEIQKEIIRTYDNLGFTGLTFSEITEKLQLGIEIDPDRLKKIIGKMIAEGILQYVDLRCYMVYPSFFDYIDSCPKVSDRNKEIIKMRLSPETLEDIGIFYNLTRERVRQIIARDVLKIRNWCLTAAERKWIDEEYFQYFYETYAFDIKDSEKWLGLSKKVWNYFNMLDIEQGSKDLRLALEDTQNLSAGLRIRIKNYLNRDKVFVDDRWVPKTKAALEEVVARKFCRDSVSFDQFCDMYNHFLEQEDIPYDEDIYYTEGVLETRKNRLKEARFLLCAFHDHYRYYDIDGHDYEELLDVLSLDSYENIELSAAKFVNDYPELMKKYDIRNQYELHNLLRKITPNGSYHDLVFAKMPQLRFGQPDRHAMILNLLCEHAPISVNDFTDLIYREFGFDPMTTMSCYLAPFDVYCHRGIYNIDQKVMTPREQMVLKGRLKDDFYYIEDIRRIYLELFPNGDAETVNPYNLKNMGFSVYSNYVLQNYTSSEAYCKHLLTEDDFTDITGFRRKYGRIPTFSNVLMELKRSLEIVEYEPNKIVSGGKLERSGMTRKMIQEYCDAVWDFTEGQTYFSMQSLQQDGFDANLFEYGFSDWFYGNLLLSDSRFSFSTMFGNMIFYRGQKAISIQTLLMDLISNAFKMDMLDLTSLLVERFGCEKMERSGILYKLQGTAAYYDDILDRVYSNAELYYQELEEGDIQ